MRWHDCPVFVVSIASNFETTAARTAAVASDQVGGFEVRIVLSLMLLAVIAGIWLFDTYCIAAGRPHDTVSSVMVELSSRLPVIPLVVGFVLGHVFW